MYHREIKSCLKTYKLYEPCLRVVSCPSVEISRALQLPRRTTLCPETIHNYWLDFHHQPRNVPVHISKLREQKLPLREAVHILAWLAEVCSLHGSFNKYRFRVATILFENDWLKPVLLVHFPWCLQTSHPIHLNTALYRTGGYFF